MEDPDVRSAGGSVRVIRLPRAAGVVLAIPILLALGAASLAALLVGVSALVFAPRLLRRGPGHRDEAPDADGSTITLDPDAYRRVDDARALLDDERR